jgi:hypothetical protein
MASCPKPNLPLLLPPAHCCTCHGGHSCATRERKGGRAPLFILISRRGICMRRTGACVDLHPGSLDRSELSRPRCVFIYPV